MTAQASQIAAMLAARDPADVAGWLARLRAALAGARSLDRETIDDLVARGRPRWGVRSDDDAAAYVTFWAELVRDHDEPRLAAAYADVLYLLGGRDRACEALAVFTAAVRRDPAMFVEYAGDFAELATSCGAAAELEFELAKIAFYALRVDQDEMDLDTLQDAVRELLARYHGDPGVRARLFEVARRSLPSRP